VSRRLPDAATLLLRVGQQVERRRKQLLKQGSDEPAKLLRSIIGRDLHEKWLEIANGDDRKIIHFKDLLREEAQEDV
jgi:hypothetical protein